MKLVGKINPQNMNILGMINTPGLDMTGSLNVYTMQTGDGRELELSRVDSNLCWRRVGDTKWNVWVSIDDLKPIKGVDYLTPEDQNALLDYVIEHINDVLPISAITGLEEALDSKLEISGEFQLGSIVMTAEGGSLECCNLSAEDIAKKEYVDQKDKDLDEIKLEESDLAEFSNADILDLWNKYIQ